MARRLIAFVLLASGVSGNCQNPLTTLPRNYWKVFENSQVTVIRAHYGAHEKIPVHDHAGFATVFVYLNDSSPVRIDHTEDGKTDSIVRPPTVTGAFRVVPGMAETHSIENLGDKPSDFLRIEFKHLNLVVPKDGFRGKAPPSLTTDQNTIEFSDPSGLKIERIVRRENEPCTFKPNAGPSLVIDLSNAHLPPSQLVPQGGATVGDAAWVPARQVVTVTSNGVPLHELRIILPIDSRP